MKGYKVPHAHWENHETILVEKIFYFVKMGKKILNLGKIQIFSQKCSHDFSQCIWKHENHWPLIICLCKCTISVVSTKHFKHHSELLLLWYTHWVKSRENFGKILNVSRNVPIFFSKKNGKILGNIQKFPMIFPSAVVHFNWCQNMFKSKYQ